MIVFWFPLRLFFDWWFGISDHEHFNSGMYPKYTRVRWQRYRETGSWNA